MNCQQIWNKMIFVKVLTFSIQRYLGCPLSIGGWWPLDWNFSFPASEHILLPLPLDQNPMVMVLSTGGGPWPETFFSKEWAQLSWSAQKSQFEKRVKRKGKLYQQVEGRMRGSTNKRLQFEVLAFCNPQTIFIQISSPSGVEFHFWCPPLPALRDALPYQIVCLFLAVPLRREGQLYRWPRQ